MRKKDIHDIFKSVTGNHSQISECYRVGIPEQARNLSKNLVNGNLDFFLIRRVVYGGCDRRLLRQLKGASDFYIRVRLQIDRIGRTRIYQGVLCAPALCDPALNLIRLGTIRR